MKSYILKIAMCASLTLCAQQASAGIRELFQNGEQVNIGDSIKGRMITFSADGVLKILHKPDSKLTTDCKIVLQEDNTAWFENLFPKHSDVHFHKWLKGKYIKDAEFRNPQTGNTDTLDILTIIPFVKIDLQEWTAGTMRLTADLKLQLASGFGLPNTYGGDSEQDYPSREEIMASYIKFIIEDDMSLTAVNAFGEAQAPLRKYHNYSEATPYGINLDKLPYTETIGWDGYEAYIRDLKLIPK